MNADGVITSSQRILFGNLFTYCINNPINYCDKSGYAIETVIDVGFAVFGFIDFIKAPSWVSFGYFVWDLASIFVPFVPGSYIAKGGKLGLKIASKIDDFIDGKKFLTGTYNALKKIIKAPGIEIHHIIEKRFKKLFDVTQGLFLSIPLEKGLHKIITSRWRNLHKISSVFKNFKYGSNYLKITKELMELAIKEVYKDMPQLLDEALEWLSQHWKG